MTRLSYASCCFIFFLSFFFHDAIGFNNHEQKKYSGIASIVNEEIITCTDLENRLNLTIFFIGEGVNVEQKNKIRNEVLKEMIQEKLKKQCTTKFSPKGGWVSIKNVHDALSDIAKRNNMTLKDFLQLLEKKNIKKEDLEKQMLVNLSWIEYIRARFSKNTNISDFELNTLAYEINEKLTQESFYVCRMFFPVTNPSHGNSLLSHVKNLDNMLSNGAEFSNIARQFSKSADANNGGELGWIFPGQLSDIEMSTLREMPIGSHKIVNINNGYVILLLRDKKAAGSKTSTDIKFKQVAVGFSQGKPNDENLKQLTEYFLDMKKSSKNCYDFIKKAQEVDFVGVSEDISGTLEQMQPNFREILSKIPVGGISDPIVTDNGIVTFCMLEKKSKKIKAQTLEEIKFQKINERLSSFASREIQYLMRKADIKVDKRYGTLSEFTQ